MLQPQRYDQKIMVCLGAKGMNGLRGNRRGNVQERRGYYIPCGQGGVALWMFGWLVLTVLFVPSTVKVKSQCDN